MERITNPVILSGYLKIVFSSSDEEEIKAKTTQMGPTIGTQTLLSLLEKRGHNAFPLFISVLRDHELKQEELAKELEEEEGRLRGKADPAEVSMRRVQSLPSRNDGEPEDNDHVELSPPPPYSVLAGSGNGRYNYNQEQLQSPLGKQPSVMEMSNQAHPAQEQTQVTPDSLVKDISYRLRMKIELMMNRHDVNNHDWKGLAGAMNMTADEVRQMEEGEKGKMAGLFDKMIHTKKTINDLLALLKHGDVQRLDVIDEIVKECDLPKEKLQMESSEDVETESAAVASSVEETSNPATKCKSLPFPRQESKEPQELDAKPDARNPSQVEDDDDPKGAAQLDTKPDARIPSQVENDDPKDAAQLDTKPDARVPSQVEGDEDPKGAAQLDTKPDARTPSQVEDSEELEFNSRSNASQVNKRISHAISTDDDDDVFDSTGDNKVKKHALLISCCRNSKSDKTHDEKLRELAEMLEDSGWETEGCFCKCKVANLLQNVHKSLCKKSGRTISFVYLVGPTVHINGENYLLPADLKSPSSRADLIHSSLNINWLVSQLSRNYMQVVIVDGAFENALTDVSFSGVLQGLAPIHPPPNAAIAFPCLPGTIRPEQERLDYIESVLNNLQNVMLPDMFDKVRAELREKRPEAFSLPVEFSLSSSLLPLCLSPGDNEGLQVPCFSNATCHAIIVSNSKYKHGLSIDTNQCLKDCERLRMALLKGQWECSEICNKTAKGIMDELGQTLNRLSADKKKKVVMVYFMGCTQMRLDCNYFFGKDFTVGSPDPLRSSVPLKWVLDLMCEKIKGPKILIVDDLSTNTTEGLVPMTAPLDVMISLPKGGDSRQYDTSFTSNFAELLKTKAGQLSLKEMIKKAASFDRHHLSSSLYLN